MMLFLLTIPASEDIYMLFYTLSVWELAKILASKKDDPVLKHALAAGIWFGLGWLTRPMSLFFPFIAVFVILVFSKGKFLASLKTAVVLVLVSFFVITPWQIYTAKNAGKFYFLSSRGVNGLRDGLSLNSSAKTFRTKFEFSADIDSMLARFQANYEGYTESKQVFDFLGNEFSNSPGTVIKYYLIKAGRVFYGTDAHRIKEEKIIRLITFPFFFFYLLSLVYFFRNRKEYALAYQVTVFSLLATLSVCAIAAISTSIARYMVPCMVINALPTGFILLLIFNKLRTSLFNRQAQLSTSKI
jgi:4-amino-4-deoxy-L-arabinose transferase-like glycosyltransferase